MSESEFGSSPAEEYLRKKSIEDNPHLQEIEHLISEGFRLVETVTLTKFKFSKDAKFEVIPDQTAKDVLEAWRQRFEKSGESVEIRSVVRNFDQGQQDLYVFVRKTTP